MKKLLLVLCAFYWSRGIQAQKNTDTSKLTLQTCEQRALHEDPVLKENPHFKEWIIPAAMVLYGALTVHIDAFTDLSEDAQDIIWNKYPHNTVTIDSYLQFAPAVAVYGLNVAGIHGAHNFLDRTMIYILSNIIMNTAVFTIKNLSHEQRPNGADYLSFPSGHTAEAFASAEFLMQEYKDVSVWYGIGGYAVATSVAYLRMYNNKHWLNDVIGGAGLGIISTRLAYILYPKIKKIFSHTPIPDSVLMPFIRIIQSELLLYMRSDKREQTQNTELKQNRALSCP